MQKLLLKNIAHLAGAYSEPPARLEGTRMSDLPLLENAWLACENGRIAAYGHMDDFEGISDWKDLQVIDCSGRMVFPGFVDSHTHIVYAGNREQEFVDRLKGLTYEQIAARGGGILNSAARLRLVSEDELYEQSLIRLEEVISQGTVGIEIKSGYGLDTESELKMLRVIRRIRELNRIPVKATFLGAHAVPPEFRNNKSGYMNLLVDTMLPAIAAEGLADYIDVFCEANYFTPDETAQILEAGAKCGLQGKVHAEQLSHSGGIAAGVKANARSVDHLEFCSDLDIQLLQHRHTIATILPGAAFFLSLQHPPVRRMIDGGLAVALASDYNPGSSPSGNMKLMMSIASIQYRMTPEEALNAATLNGAYACGLESELGSISPGKMANFIISRPGVSYATLCYAFGSDVIGQVVLNGHVQLK